MKRRDAIKRVTLLLGGTISAPTLAGLLGGCRAEPTPSGGFAPRTLSEQQYQLVSTLSEHILPETDTPGAIGAGVPEYIDNMLTDWYPDEDRDQFLSGLAEVDAMAQAEHNAPFLDLSSEQQVALMTGMDEAAFPDVDSMSDSERQAYAAQVEANGRPFFATMKELTITGYYTSEVGATQELRVMPMGVYRADVPYEELGRAWA